MNCEKTEKPSHACIRLKNLIATKLVTDKNFAHALLLFSSHTLHVRSVTLANSDMLNTECHTMEGPSMHSAEIAMNTTWYHQLMAETRNQPWKHSATLPTISRYNKQKKV